ncbi:unnamed protein product [Adineta ricciae]|uniref:Integrase catalytic domain-containing protein n=1 Tax=Adineta ricciae TaxID=249248 RepID=A0A816CFB5_ADIRI|nr:unnamed protein product [Adineta ricciae]
MHLDIRNHIKSCIPCLQNNHHRQKPPGFLKPIKPPEGVWQLLTMDFHGPITPSTQRGNKYIIALTDVLSKFVITKAVRDCTAATAARFITEEAILKYGTPKCVLTDNGTHFTSAMMKELFKKMGVTQLYSTPYHPMTNGQIERYNATMDSKIAALSNVNRTNWDEQLPFVTFNYNTSIHTTTGHIPFELMYGRTPVLPFDQHESIVSIAEDPDHGNKLKRYLASLTNDARDNIQQQQQKYKHRYDQYRMNPKYTINDLVLVKVSNFRNKFDIRPTREKTHVDTTNHLVRQLINRFRWILSNIIVNSSSISLDIIEHHRQLIVNRLRWILPNIIVNWSNNYTMTTRNSCGSSTSHSPRYISPLQRLDRRTRSWQSKRAAEDDRLERLHKEGKCHIFDPLSQYQCYFVNRCTSCEVLHELIERSQQTTVFTIDTEDQTRPSQSSLPALIQVEFVYKDRPSILILVETLFLPQQHEEKFQKIKQIFKHIFARNNQILLWGGIKDELAKFYRFELFNRSDIDQVNERNIQDKFKEYYHANYSYSPDMKMNSNEKYSLQHAIHSIYNEWLTKRFTLGDFGCGLDPELKTATIPEQFYHLRQQILHDEEQYRQHLIQYSLNDCLAVTKLANEIIDINEHEATNRYLSEQTIDDEQTYEIEIHAPTHTQFTPPPTTDPEDIEYAFDGNSISQAHENFVYLDDGQKEVHMDELPELTIPEQSFGVHAEYEPANEADMVIMNNDQQQGIVERIEAEITTTRQLKRTQRKNMKKRARRYDFEVIRYVYHRFNETMIKNILAHINK